MTQKTIKFSIDEIYSKPPKKLCHKKTDVYHIDEIWSLNILDLKTYGPENNRKDRYVLVVINNFSKYASTMPLKNAQTIKDFFGKIIKSSKSSPKLFEGDRDRRVCNSNFQSFLNNKNNNLYSRKHP